MLSKIAITAMVLAVMGPIISVFGDSPHRTPSARARPVTARDIEVYRAILDSGLSTDPVHVQLARPLSSKGPVVFVNATLTGDCIRSAVSAMKRDWTRFPRRSPSASRRAELTSMGQLLIARNTSGVHVPSFSNRHHVHFIDRSGFAKLFRGDGCYVYASLPVYSRDGRYAILCLNTEGSKMGYDGELYLLHRRHGRWQVERFLAEVAAGIYD